MNTQYPFLSNSEAPDNLLRVYEYLQRGNEGSLELHVPFLGTERILRLVGSQLSADLIPLFTMANGGVIAVWIQNKSLSLENQPIVWLDSEGSPSEVFAENLDSLFALLHYSQGSIYDVIFANQMNEEDPELFESAIKRFSLEEFTQAAAEDWDENETLNSFHNWLEANLGVSIEENPIERITNATKSFPSFQKLLNEIGT